MNNYTTKFLNSFFTLFDAYVIKIDTQNGKIKGTVNYNDGSGSQEFEWSSPQSTFWNEAIFLLDLISENGYAKGDIISISSQELAQKIDSLEWPVEKVDRVLQFIFSINVSMVDNGRITDGVFIHS